MTVKELIEKLNKFDPNSKVKIMHYYFYWDDILEDTVDGYDSYNVEEDSVVYDPEDNEVNINCGSL